MNIFTKVIMVLSMWSIASTIEAAMNSGGDPVRSMSAARTFDVDFPSDEPTPRKRALMDVENATMLLEGWRDRNGKPLCLPVALRASVIEFLRPKPITY